MKLRDVANIANPTAYRRIVARTLVLKELKKIYGDDLLLVGFSGSATKHVKRAGAGSDVDIFFMLKTTSGIEVPKGIKQPKLSEIEEHNFRIADLCREKFGVEAMFRHTTINDQLITEMHEKIPYRLPLEVVYGKEFAEKHGLSIKTTSSERKDLRRSKTHYGDVSRRPVLGLPKRISNTIRRK